MRTLYIVRHGQTLWNLERRMQGRMDSALTDAGKAQAIGIGQLLKSLGGIEQMIVSPSGRTQETAFLLNSFLGAEMNTNEVLMERDCGIWSGMTVGDISEQFPQEWEARRRDPYAHRPPGGENTADVVARAEEFVDGLHSLPDERIALVTHSIMSRAILTHLLQLPPKQSSAVRHPNDALYRLDVSPTGYKACHYVAGQGPTPGLLLGSAEPQAAPKR